MADSTPEEESAGQDVPEKDTADDNVLDEMLSKSLDEAYAEEPEEPQDDGTTSEEIEAQDEDTAQDEAPPPEDVEASEGDTDHEEVKAETPEVPPLDAPQHWLAADKERFNGMPRDAQEYVLERDKSMTADYTRKTQDVAQIRQAYEPLHHVLNPMRQALQQSGISEAEYVARLIQADRNLQQNPYGAIQQLARNAGINLEALEQPQAATVQQPDPQVNALQQQVQQLQGYVQGNEERAAQERQAGLLSQIDSFSAQTDADGNVAHPHFDALRVTMGQLIEAGAAADLEDAYSKALRLDDTLYQQSLEAERTKVKAAAEKRRKEAVAKAKKVPSRRSANPPAGNMQSNNLDDILGNALDNAGL